MRAFCAAILGMILFGTAHAAEPVANRILRIFDFEERRLGNPEELPMHWAKVEGSGMPHYVNGHLATDRARNGKYSFRFDLNGGSLVYRYDAKRIKVQPRSNYRVEGYVQTTALAHARARLSAYFVDIDGQPIASSIQHSELYAARNPDEPWKHLQVELSTDNLPADTLVIELELLQPVLYAMGSLGTQTLYPQDIRGSAWFDDVMVSQVPQVWMSTNKPGNIFRKGEALNLEVVVSDRSTDDLAAQLVIHDALGKAVYQRSGALDMQSAENLGPAQKKMRLMLPPLTPGWYEARLVMTSQGQYVGQQMLDLVLLADNAPLSRPDERFGIIATDLPFDGWSELPEILPFLGTGRVKLAVWSKAGDVQQTHAAMFDTLLVKLREQGITPTACLLDLPPQVTNNAPDTSWSYLLKARPEEWQPRLAYMVSRHANNLDRWQMGADGSDLFVNRPEMRQIYQMVYGEFAKLVQKPDLAMPWPAWHEMDGQLPATVALSIHPSVLPQQLPLYMQDILKSEGHNLSLSLQLLDARQYGRELQIRDLAQRVVYALAAGASRIDLPVPFTVVNDKGVIVKQPQELLMILRTLTTTLGGSSFRGKVPIADGVEAFLFEKSGQGILALWDRGSLPGVKKLALTLGQRPMAIDLWGNVTPLLRPTDPSNQTGQVQLTLGPMPIFLVDIDGPLAQLRASVAIDRPLIESSFMPHTRRIRFSNPYRQAISGTLKIKGPPGWTLTPPTFSFSINPNEVFQRDLTIEFPYNSYAGPKTIEAQFEIQADRLSTLTVPITLTLGLSDVGMQTMAIRDGKDVLVQQMITNYGDKKIDYTAFAIFPGQARQERLVTSLDPGRTTIKLYRFPNVQVTPKTRVRAGVKELDGTRILNDEVEVQ
ncbi:MAG: hypothetical protein ACM359_18745 [Bacillota bacterium]